MDKRTIALSIMRCLLGIPYKWGGNDPSDGGLDCSGAVRFCLRIVGIVPWQLDYTAKDFLRMFRDKKVDKGYPGCLAFYGQDWADISHVMMCVDSKTVIGASSGHVKVGQVQELPLTYRDDLVAIVDPFLGS